MRTTTLRLIVRCKRYCRKHVVAAVKRPHHYYTAAGMTGLLFVIKQIDKSLVMGAWLYALVETINDGVDDV